MDKTNETKIDVTKIIKIIGRMLVTLAEGLNEQEEILMENIIMEIAKGVYEEIGKGIVKLSEDSVRKKEIETDGNVKVAKINGGAKVKFYNIILGVMTYKVLSSGLVMLMMPTQLQQLILGVIFLIEVALFSDRKTGMIVK